MRSFTPKTILIASLFSALPLAGAYALPARHHHPSSMDDTDPTLLRGPRVSVLLDQVQGVDQGIVEAHQGDEIRAPEARMLENRANGVARMAERVAAENHGRVPAARYRQLLRRLDNVDQQLRVDTGGAFNIGDGSDSGHYPNG